MLDALGVEVVALIRPNSEIRHLKQTSVRIVRGDLLDQVAVTEALHGATHIFHCAACSTDWAPEKTYFEANVLGTQSLVHAAVQLPKFERFLHVSTTDVYGYPETPCDETQAPVETALPYNRTKLQGERAVWSAGREQGLPFTIVRPGTIYGPRGKDFTTDMAALLKQRLMAYINGGSATGGFTYVDNVVEAMLAASQSPATLEEAFNVADGTGATWKNYLEQFAAQLGTKPPWIDLSFRAAISIARVLETPHRLGIPGKPLLTRHAVYLLGRDQEFPNRKARNAFGFVPTVGIEEGISRSVRWLRDGRIDRRRAE